MLRIGVDIDDTLCDFHHPLMSFISGKGINTKHDDYSGRPLHEIWSTDKETAENLLKEFIYSHTELTPYHYSQECLSRFKDKIEFYAITARDYELTEVTQKWLDTNYPQVFKKLYVCNTHGTNDKPRYCKTEICEDLGIKFFIDDRPENIKSSNINCIIYDQSWNRNIEGYRRVKNWKEIEMVLLNEYFSLNRIRIGISGKIGCGKTSLTHYMEENLPVFKYDQFARRLKQTVAGMCDVDISLTYSREGKSKYMKEFGKTIGQLLQIVSQSVKRDLGDQIWLNCVTMSETYESNSLVIEDVRFKMEANILRQDKTILLRIEGDPVGMRARNEDSRDLNHISETELDDYDFDYVIHNNCTLENFHQEIRNFLLSLI